MTSRRAAPGPDGSAATTATGEGEPPARPVPPRGGSVAPQPRLDPADPPVGVAPTTGAVDAVPRRVPLRQRRPSPGGTPAGDGAAFRAPIQEVHRDGPPLREEPRTAGRSPAGPLASRRVRTRASHRPDPLVGMAVLVTSSLLAAFFAWVSAGPFWVAVGHSTSGTAVITDCSGAGLTQHCRGIFLADAERFVAHDVRVSGVPAERSATGTALPARMTGPDGGIAYADSGVGRHLRWLLGLLLVAACAAAIARWTGATRLPDPRHCRWAVGAALAGPTLITAGFLAAAW